MSLHIRSVGEGAGTAPGPAGDSSFPVVIESSVSYKQVSSIENPGAEVAFSVVS